MRPALRHAALAAACVAALALAGCGKHVAPDAPMTFAPADTPYLFANFKGAPEDVTEAWGQANDAVMAARIQQLGKMAELVGQKNPEVADGPQSRILDQVANGVATRMAVLAELLATPA